MLQQRGIFFLTSVSSTGVKVREAPALELVSDVMFTVQGRGSRCQGPGKCQGWGHPGLVSWGVTCAGNILQQVQPAA